MLKTVSCQEDIPKKLPPKKMLVIILKKVNYKFDKKKL